MALDSKFWLMTVNMALDSKYGETLCGSLEEPMESNSRTGNVGLPNILTFM